MASPLIYFRSVYNDVTGYVAGLPKTSAPVLLHPGYKGAAFFQHPYDKDHDYTKSQNELPNNDYAKTHHPSEARVAESTELVDGTRNEYGIWTDSAHPIEVGSGIVGMSVAGGDMIDYVATAAGGHFFGKAVCQTINVCDGSVDRPGSGCDGPNGEHGFCYESKDSGLLCGRLLSLNDEYEQHPVALDASALYGTLSQEPYRCPRFTAATELGTVSVSRLMIGGCMDSTDDDEYDANAEIHVKAMCSTGKGEGIKVGCLFPGAENFDPLAQAPGKCTYQTRGCTSATALNFNSEASINDDSCIEPIEGCTIKTGGYDGVDSNTPMFQDRFFGSALRAVGKVPFSLYPDVTNYLETANVLKGCEVAIEGCMQEFAEDGVTKNINYESFATSNKNSWCIPEVPGCMLPSSTNSKMAWTGDHDREGFAYNFDPSATKHVKEICTVYRLGCMEEGSLNYDQYATVEDHCYKQLSGCLDTAALNVGCASPGLSDCPNGLVDKHADQITHHQPNTCTFYYSPPPSPPPPVYPPNTIVSVKAYSVKMEMIVEAQPTSGQIQQAIDHLKTQYPDATITITVVYSEPDQRRRLTSHGSYKMLVSITSATEEAAEDVKTSVLAETGTVEATMTFLGGSITDVVSVPVTIITPVYDVTPAPTPPPPSIPPPSPPPPKSEVPIAAIVGGVVGGVVGLACIGAIVFFMMKKKGKAVKPDY